MYFKFTLSIYLLISINVFSQKTNIQDTIYLEKVDLLSNKASDDEPIVKETIFIEDYSDRNLSADIPSLLKLTPSMLFTSDAGNGIGYSTIRLRGSDQTRISVTINGVPLNDAESKGVWFVDIPNIFSSSNYIQIQRGVGVSTIGSGSFGGQINLSTFQNKKNPHGSIDYSMGSFNTSKQSVSFGTGLLKNYFSLSGRISHIQSDGYIDRSDSDLKSYYLSAKFNSEKSMIELISFGGIEETGQAWYGVPYSYIDNKKIRTYNPYTYENQIDHYEQMHHQMHMHHIFSESFKASSTLYYTKGKGYYENYESNESLLNYGFSDDAIVNLVNRKWLDNDLFGFVFKTDVIKPGYSHQAGLSINKYDGIHYGKVMSIEGLSSLLNGNNEYYNGSGDKLDGSIYSQTKFNFGKFFLFTDWQYRYINYKIKGTDDNLIIPKSEYKFYFFNPKIGLLYNSSDNQNIFASFSIANNEPNRNDFIDAINSTRKPQHETLYDTEIQYSLVNDKVHISTTLYHMYYKNQLVLTGEINDVGAALRTNVDDSYRIGMEFTSDVKISEKLNFNFNINVSENKIKSFTEYIDNWNTGEQEIIQHGKTNISFSPSFIASSSIIWDILSKKHNKSKSNFKLIFDSKYVSDQYTDNTNNDDRKIHGYVSHDLALSYSIKKNKKEIKLKFLVNNLFNTLYSTSGWVYPFISSPDWVDVNNPYILEEANEDEIYTNDNIWNMSGFYPQATTNYMIGIELNF